MIFSSIATAIGGALGLGATSFFVTATSFVLKTAANIGLNMLLGAMAGQDQGPRFSINGKLGAGADYPRTIPIGWTATAGSLVWANTWGEEGDTPNAYLTQVIALGDMPCSSLVGIHVNGEPCTVLTAEEDPLLGYPVEEYRRIGTHDHIWIRFHDGSQTAADFLCVTKAANAERPYESTRVGVGITYVVITTLIDETLFTGFPAFKFILNGMKMYDITKDTTAGGSGAHRWNDPSTWGGDGDHLPAVQAYNIARGIYYSNVWLYGGQNIPAARFNYASWAAAITKCRTTRDIGGGDMKPTYRSGGEILVNQNVADALDTVLATALGRLIENGGQYKVHIGEPGSSVFAITDDVIISTREQSFTPFFSLADSVSGIVGRYPSPDDGWNTAIAPPIIRSDIETLIGNRRVIKDISLDFCPYPEQVQRVMNLAFKEALRARRHTFVLPSDYWTLEVGDVGVWTSTRNGYSSKQFRVDGIIDLADADVMVDLTEIDPSDYSWNANTDYSPVIPGVVVMHRPPPQDIYSWTATAAAFLDDDDNERRPGILLEWNGTVSGVDLVKFEIRRAATTEVIARGSTEDYAAGELLVGPFLPATAYEARGAFVPSGRNRETNWSSWALVITDNILIDTIDILDNAITSAKINDAAVTANKIAIDAINATHFASSLSAVEIFATAPTTGNYEGRMYYNTTDNKLYRYDGSAWIASVATVDLVGTISTGQLADTAVTNAKLANASVTASKLASAAVDATKIASSISAVELFATAPSTGNYDGRMYYNTTDKKLYRYNGSAWTTTTATTDLTGTISNSQVASNAITADKIATAAVTAGKIEDAAVTAAKLAAQSVYASKLYVSEFSNIFPDYDLEDTAFYSVTAGTITFTASGPTTVAGRNYMSFGANQATDCEMVTSWFAIERLQDFVAQMSLGSSGSGPTVTGYIETASISGSTITPIRRVQIAVASGSTLTKYSEVFTSSASERRARFVVVRSGSATSTTARTAALVVRLRTNSELIVDSAITNAKLADAAVTLAKLQAGAVDATKLATSISAVELFATAPSTGNYDGRMYYNTTDKKLYRHNGTSWTTAVAATDITGTLTAGQLADGSVTSVKLADAAVTAAKLASAAVDATKLATSISAVELFATAPSTGNYDGRVYYNTADKKLYRHNGTAWIATVPTSDLTGTISNGQIADSAVTATKIADAAVTATKLASAAVDATKVASSISVVELFASAPGTGNYNGRMYFNTTDKKLYRHNGTSWITTTATSDLTGTIANSQIADDAVTAGKIASGAVTSTKIANATIGTSHLVSTISAVEIVGSLPASDNYEGRIVYLTSTNKLYRYDGSAWIVTTDTSDLNGQITTTQITDNAITTAKVAANAITAAQIAAGTITATQIASATITAGLIAAGAINATHIATDSITAKHILVSDNQNLIPNGEFIAGVDGFTASALYTPWLATDAGVPAGAPTRQGITVGTSAGNPTITTKSFPLIPGETYRAVLTVWQSAAQTTGYIDWRGAMYDNADASIGGAFSSSVLRFSPTGVDGWTTKTTTFVAPSNAATYRPQLLAFAPTAGWYYIARWALYRMANADLIVDGSVIASKIAADAVTSAKIAAGTIQASDIAAGTITANEIAAATITGAKIAATTITAANIAANTITAAQIAANTLTAGTIQAGAIGTSQLAAGAVTTSILAAGAVTADIIAADSITAKHLVIADTTNIIPNPDFDQTTAGLDGWSFSSGLSQTVLDRSSLQASLQTGITQNKVLRVTGDSNTRDIYATHYFPVREGEQYYYEFWYATDTAGYTGPCYSYIRVMDADGNSAPSSATVTAPTTTWQKATRNYTVAAGTRKIVLGVRPQGTGNLYLTGFRAYRRSSSELIVDGAISAAKIAADAVTSDAIAAGTIVASDIASGTITATQIAANTITAGVIAAGAIGTTQLAANAVTASIIAADAVTATQIAASAVGTDELVANAVTAAKIAANTITAAQIASNTITASQIAAGTITTNEIAANAITTGLVAAGAINTTQLAAGAVTATILASDSVVAGKIAAGTIVAADIASNAITTAKLDALAVTTDKIASNSITTGLIAAGAITTTTIATGAVTAVQLAADSVIAGKIAVGAVTAREIIVTDPENLVPNGYWEDSGDSNRYWTTPTSSGTATYTTNSLYTKTGGRALNLAKTTLASQVYISLQSNFYFPVTGGESYWAETEIITDGPATTVGFYFRIYWYQADKTTAASAAYTDIAANTAIPTSWTIYSGMCVAPADARFGAVRLYNNSSQTTTYNCFIDRVVVRRAAAGKLVVDGSITAAKIAAGAITAGKLAANSVFASNIVIGGESNAYPDYDLMDSAFYTATAGTITFTGTTSVNAGRRYGEFGTTQASDCEVQTGWVPVEPSSDYYAGISISCSASDVTRTGYIELASMSSGGTPSPTRRVQIETGTGTTLTRFSTNIVTSAAERRARFVVVRTGSASATGARFAAPILRRRYTGTLIVDGAISAAKIAADAVTSAAIAAGTIVASDIASGTITATQLAANTITAGVIAAGAIGTTQLAAGAVTTSILAADSVTAGILAANSVVAGDIVAGAVTTAALDALAVTTDKIAANAVTALKIAANTITASQIAANTITSGQIAANTITAGQIQAGAINTTQLAAGAVTSTILSSDAVVAGKIAAGAITARELVLTDWENLVANGYWQDSGLTSRYWTTPTGSGTLTYNTTYTKTGSRSVNLAKTVLANTVNTEMLSDFYIPVTAGEKLYCETEIITDGTATTVGFYFRILWFQGDKTTAASPSYNNVASNVAIPTSWTVYSGQLTVPTNARWARVQLYNYSSQTTTYNCFIDRIVVRRAKAASLIVDGSITAAKLNVTTLSAITADLGTVTAGLIKGPSDKLIIDATNGKIEFYD